MIEGQSIFADIDHENLSEHHQSTCLRTSKAIVFGNQP